jgi:hypothetical protein
LRTITISLEVPEDIRVRVAGVPGDSGGERLSDWDWLTEEEPARSLRAVAAPAATVTPVECPVHQVPWKVVPAGVSRRTGRPYEAFRACPQTGCEEKPR